MQQLIDFLEGMKGMSLSNYVIPGLTSHLLDKGKFRLFTCSRNHQEVITPHTHRFDFACLVVRGRVVNRIWEECSEEDGDFYEVSAMTFDGTFGEYKISPDSRGYFRHHDEFYGEGQWYFMNHEQMHSIKFTRGAQVLFLEGPQIAEKTYFIEPVVDGQKIPTFEVKDWMFKRDVHVG